MQIPTLVFNGDRFPGKAITPEKFISEYWDYYPPEIMQRVNIKTRSLLNKELVIFSPKGDLLPLSDPLPDKGLAIEFSRIRYCSDIAGFASKYGLLGIESSDHYVYDPHWYNEPWVEYADDWLWASEKVLGLLNIYKQLQLNVGEILIWEGLPFLDLQCVEGKDLLTPREAMTVLAENITFQLQGVIDIGYEDIIPTTKTLTKFQVVEKRTTSYLIAAIYYDLWRMISLQEPVQVCKNCGLPFKIGKRRRDYCNNACRQEAYRKRLENHKDTNIKKQVIKMCN